MNPLKDTYGSVTSVRWVTVEKQLPEDRTDVLFYSSDLRNPVNMLLGRYIDGRWLCAGYEMTNVTHWALPPSPPTSE